ncbi:MAG TPA: hypothetical protein VIG88_01205, partial [Lysobacter sp.]
VADAASPPPFRSLPPLDASRPLYRIDQAARHRRRHRHGALRAVGHRQPSAAGPCRNLPATRRSQAGTPAPRLLSSSTVARGGRSPGRSAGAFSFARLRMACIAHRTHPTP